MLDELSKRLVGFNEIVEREPLLRGALKTAETDYKNLAKQLSVCRRLAKTGLEQRVMTDLKQVAMESTQFAVNLSTATLGGSDNDCGGALANYAEGDQSYSFSPYGIDRVEFLLSANLGESPRPLAYVASGGELSRLMLTLRTIGTNQQDDSQQGSETLIFDEIDVGIGGRVAEAVGRRLRSLAEMKQVLCVTHQPQIARFADHHYLIEKLVATGRTRTVIKELNLEERVGELARMIGGDEHVQAARETARWLLDHSNKNRGRSSPRRKSSKF
jgi:DNA repair protein RecN (Recombination protein N)